MSQIFFRKKGASLLRHSAWKKEISFPSKPTKICRRMVYRSSLRRCPKWVTAKALCCKFCSSQREKSGKTRAILLCRVRKKEKQILKKRPTNTILKRWKVLIIKLANQDLEWRFGLSCLRLRRTQPKFI